MSSKASRPKVKLCIEEPNSGGGPAGGSGRNLKALAENNPKKEPLPSRIGPPLRAKPSPWRDPALTDVKPVTPRDPPYVAPTSVLRSSFPPWCLASTSFRTR